MNYPQANSIEDRIFEVNTLLDLLKEYDEHQLAAFVDVAKTIKEQDVDQPYELWCELSNIYRDIHGCV